MASMIARKEPAQELGSERPLGALRGCLQGLALWPYRASDPLSRLGGSWRQLPARLLARRPVVSSEL